MRHHLATYLILSAVIVISTGAIIAQQPAQKPLTPEERAALMQKYQELSQPGEEHKKLAQLEGNWNYAVKMWMSPAGGNPMITQGKGEAKMVLGGRFLQTTSAGSMMGMPSRPYPITVLIKGPKNIPVSGLTTRGHIS